MNPRITHIPSGWRESRVGNEFTIANNLREPINAEDRKNMHGPYPYYGPTKAVDSLDHFRVEGTYALIGEDGDHFLKYGAQDMTQLVTGKYNVNNHAHLIKGNGDCTTEWFFEYFRMRALTPYLTRQGAGRYKLNKTVLEELPILVPPHHEQTQIHKYINAWDHALEQITKLIAAKKLQHKGLIQQLLSGKLRFPEFKNKWKKVKFNEVIKSVHRPVPKPKTRYRALGIRSHFKGTFEKYINDPASVAMDELYIAKEGDLIINITFAWEGAVAIVPKEHNDGLVSHRFPMYGPVEEKIDLDFLRYIVIQPRFKYLLGAISPGGAGRNRVLNKKDFLNLEILLPDIKEQRKIGGTLKIIDKEVELLQQQLDALKEQKKGLMQQLLTGKKRVKVLEAA